MKDDPLFVKLGKLRNHKGSMLQAADMVIGTNVTFCEACSARFCRVQQGRLKP